MSHLKQVRAISPILGQPFAGAAAEDVTFSYGGETVLDGVSLQILEGGITGIVGRSGSVWDLPGHFCMMRHSCFWMRQYHFDAGDTRRIRFWRNTGYE